MYKKLKMRSSFRDRLSPKQKESNLDYQPFVQKMEKFLIKPPDCLLTINYIRVMRKRLLLLNIGIIKIIRTLRIRVRKVALLSILE